MAFFQLYLLMRIFDSIGGLPLAAAIYGSLLACLAALCVYTIIAE